MRTNQAQLLESSLASKTLEDLFPFPPPLVFQAVHENRLQDVAQDADEASETKADTCPTLVACLCMFLFLRLSLYLPSSLLLFRALFLSV